MISSESIDEASVRGIESEFYSFSRRTV